MLPLLASWYAVSVDELLGVGQIRKQMQIEACRNAFHELRENLEERYKICAAAYREFPYEPEIVHLLVCTLYHMGLDENRSEIVRLSEWLLTHANQAGQYFGAVRNLTYAYGKYGNEEMARKYAAMGGRYLGTETQLLIHVLQGQKAVMLCRSNISQLVDLIAANVGVMLQQGEYDPEETAALAQMVAHLYEITNGISDEEKAETWKQRFL